MTELIVQNISLGYKIPEEEAVNKAIKKLKSIISPKNIVSASINRRSVDARNKNDIKLLYSVYIKTDLNIAADKLEGLGAVILEKEFSLPRPGHKKSKHRPVIIGMGPAGMFAALELSRLGYEPIILERGKNVFDRQRDIEAFYSTRVLDENSNIQFGAGGAGTFSDGKLLTRVNSPICRYVLEKFVSFGAPNDILVNAKPHIGTDILVNIVNNIEKFIISHGGEIHYSTTAEEFIMKNAECVGIKTNKGDIPCSCVILATGHSSRDTFEYLISSGFTVIPKDFSCGVRIEHLRSDIDKAMLGDADLSILGSAEYTLSLREGQRGVYTFCMCPGGEIVGATSESGSVVVNGMSRHARNGLNSNSAVAVSVLKEDYGNTPLGAIEFQRRLEKAAYRLGGNDYSVPVMTVGAFLGTSSKNTPDKVFPSYMGGNAYTPTDIKAALPPFMTSMLQKGLLSFDKKIKGFADPSAILSGFETRTSSPVRIQRNDDLTAIGTLNIFPSGEGAGYAGGITSAAIDGIKAACRIIAEYAPKNKD